MEIERENLYQLNKRGFRYVKSILINRTLHGSTASPYLLEIILSNLGGLNAEIRAFGVIDLRIGAIDNMLALLLDAIDVKSHQLEGINYKIFDTENDIISFYCESFEVANSNQSD